ncbi:MAG: hypothetical protein ALECFALPRED_009724 [Alectoria fallacina]|uniref:Uncharacterized protein n=1 Tax=Alectoria fallacina TaxID=1903189 RepID=A0A8H3J8E2_9LECA|nr:MAG: hypothetical protein ALECFALPRED_009724 [Alectoria fallacina]
MAAIKTLAMTPSPSLGYEQCLDEALADSRFLQVLAGNLLGSLQRKQYELQQTSPYEDDPMSAATTLQSIDDLILSLQNIRRDIDANIDSFYNTPAKTFLQSNIEQLTAIYQLWYILPKLRPFIPDVASSSSPSSSSPSSADDHSSTLTYRTSPAAEIQAWRETKKSAGCFDREPRSLSVVPRSRLLDRDVKEIQDGRAMQEAGGFGILYQP